MVLIVQYVTVTARKAASSKDFRFCSDRDVAFLALGSGQAVMTRACVTIGLRHPVVDSLGCGFELFG